MSILKLASTCLINAPAQKPHKQVVNQYIIHFLFSKNSSVPMQCQQDSNKNTFPWLSVTLCLKCISKSTVSLM